MGIINKRVRLSTAAAILCVSVAATSFGQAQSGQPLDPAKAPQASIDRFSDAAGALYKRSANGTLPAANAPIDFDKPPFISQGLGPKGEVVKYYNFDVQSATPCPLYVLVDAAGRPIPGQLNIVAAIPGDKGYSDFWQVNLATVPSGYVANTITSVEQLLARTDVKIAPQKAIVSCPVVPAGSTARLRIDKTPAGLSPGWYKDQVIHYFTFENPDGPKFSIVGTEKDLKIGTSPIYVFFANGRDPSGGFQTESNGVQTHNTVATLPGDDAYSPLWDVNVLPNDAFAQVKDLASVPTGRAQKAGALVNCPVVNVRNLSQPLDPSRVPHASIDRFSDAAGALFRRAADKNLPAANVPIDFDQGPFITQGLGPKGEMVKYYNFDVQIATPAPIYVLIDGSGKPISGQLNVVGVIPGDKGYSDFWQVHMVTVPSGYVSNTITSAEQVLRRTDVRIAPQRMIVNCPIVPAGSVARLRIDRTPSGLTQGWYKDQVVYYLNFENPDGPKYLVVGTERDLRIGTSPIYVFFANGRDPSGGFLTESNSLQTHNTVATLPGDDAYSPLWDVQGLSNDAFAQVKDLASVPVSRAQKAGALVNCPIVNVSSRGLASGVHTVVVNVQVQREAPAPVRGLEVAFARSISGRPAIFEWRGITDENGKVTVRITAQDEPAFRHAGASGYYRARLTEGGGAGAVVDQWSSIPLRGGRMVDLLLPTGRKAAIVGPFFGTPIQAAGKSVIDPTVTVLSGVAPTVPAMSLDEVETKVDGTLDLPVQITGAKDLSGGDLTLTYDPALLAFRGGRIGGTGLTVAQIEPGRVSLSFEGLPPTEQTSLMLSFDRRSGDVLGNLKLTGLLYDRDLMPVAEVQAEARLNGQAPAHYALFQNHPNPFNPATQISFQMPEPGRMRLIVYNALGQRVRTLVDQGVEAGFHRISWDGRDDQGRPVSSGLYLYRMEVGEFSQAHRMLLLK